MLCQWVPSCALAREHQAWIALGLSRPTGHNWARPGIPQDRRLSYRFEGVEFRCFSPESCAVIGEYMRPKCEKDPYRHATPGRPNRGTVIGEYIPL